MSPSATSPIIGYSLHLTFIQRSWFWFAKAQVKRDGIYIKRRKHY